MNKLYYYLRYAWNYLYFLTHPTHRSICQQQIKAQQDFNIRHELDQMKTYNSDRLPGWDNWTFQDSINLIKYREQFRSKNGQTFEGETVEDDGASTKIVKTTTTLKVKFFE